MSAGEVHPLYALSIEGSRNPVSGELYSPFVLARSVIVQKDSGVQIVYSGILHALARATRFKSPFRERAIEMVLADLGGMIILSSEQGAYAREFSTQRNSVPIGQVTGQPVTDLDIYMHEQVMGEKGKFKNNPHKKGFGIDF